MQIGAADMAERGWYPDPVRRHVLRWFDGSTWTEHVFDGSARTTDPGGAPASSPEPSGEDAWLPPPELPDVKRWGPFAAGVPSGGPENVPAGGYEPVRTGNRALDVAQSYVNEFESQQARDASLLRAAWTAGRRARGLRAITVVLALLALAGFAALGLAVYAAWIGASDPFGVFFLVVVLAVVVLPAIYVVPNVVAFGAATAAGLALVEGRTTSAGSLLRALWRARGPLGALVLARVAWWVPGLAAKIGAALYEAVAVFAVPAALDEGLRLGAARRRSEELVAERWGPGRFRALGLPQTNPWSIVYTRGVASHGYKAPYLAAVAFLAILLGPFLVALAIGDTTLVLVAFAWMWGSVALGGLVWASSIQPSVQGVLRAHLYHYAKTGKAVAPFEQAVLHACLREEARARLGLAQRRRGTGPGVTPDDVRDVMAGARELYRDGKKVTNALRRAPGGLDAASLVAATGLPKERARVTVVNLVWTGKLRADVDPGGRARFTLSR